MTATGRQEYVPPPRDYLPPDDKTLSYLRPARSQSAGSNRNSIRQSFREGMSSLGVRALKILYGCVVVQPCIFAVCSDADAVLTNYFICAAALLRCAGVKGGNLQNILEDVPLDSSRAVSQSGTDIPGMRGRVSSDVCHVAAAVALVHLILHKLTS